MRFDEIQQGYGRLPIDEANSRERRTGPTAFGHRFNYPKAEEAGRSMERSELACELVSQKDAGGPE